MSNADDTGKQQDSGQYPARDPTKGAAVRIRSVAGIDGLAARYVQSTSSIAAVPSSLDIRKARRTAKRARTMGACEGCQAARYLKYILTSRQLRIIAGNHLSLLQSCELMEQVAGCSSIVASLSHSTTNCKRRLINF